MSTLPALSGLSYVLGGPEGFSARPLRPFAPEVRALLSRLSERLVADPGTRRLPDVMSFAWWCRRANLERLAAAYEDGHVRLGRGLAFHVTPANMPVNFAFSWAFSLAAGNANVVRLPTREFPQIPFLLDHLRGALEDGSFAEIARSNCFVRYGREEAVTGAFSAIADARIIWGGDATIQAIRKHPIPARSVDVAFADRYSIAVLGAEALLALDGLGLDRLAAGFFNDAYLMDQNACSSPRLVVWLGAADAVQQARERFWGAVSATVERQYQLSPVGAVDKLTQACLDAVELDSVGLLQKTDNRLFRVELGVLPPGIEERRCNFGYFYEFVAAGLDDVAPIVTTKFQTITYFGVDRATLASFVTTHRIPGVDRIVPVGSALDIGILWDGFDLVRTLSRVCDVH